MLRTLYPWQRDWITDLSPEKHIVTSRQVGKTHFIGLEVAVVSAQGITGPLCGNRALIVSKDDLASKEVLRETVRWLRVLQEAGLVRIDGEISATRVALTNGVSVVSLPGGRPEAIRGPGGSVWLDEYAFHRAPDDNYQAAVGVTTRGGLLRMVSTPYSDHDLFWRVRTNKGNLYPDWSKHILTIHQAIRAGLLKPNGQRVTLEELRRKQPDPDRFACEYECIPLSDSLSYLGDLIEPARLRYVEGWSGGSLYGGFDVARSGHGDASAMCEVRRENDRYQAEPTVWADKGEEFEAQQARAVRYFNDRGWVRMAVDAQGLGMPVAESIQKRLGRARVDSVAMTSQAKADMMTTLRGLMEMGQLALPPDDDLLLDLRSIKRIIGDTNIRYDAERNERGHADRAWALALAVRAAGSEPAKTQRQVRIRRRRRPRDPFY